MKPCLWFRYHSVLFQSTLTKNYFTIEPLITDDKLTITPAYFDPYDPKYQDRGFVSIEMSPITIVASQLFHEIARALRQFDQYTNENRRTCLLYCRQLGRNLKCIPSKPVYALIPEPNHQTWI